ncbi:MAG TPA: damage-inducible protein DinB, partial [Flavobacterium sp.]
MTTTEIISKDALLKHWLGHRKLTRKVIDAFPEKDFFEFSIGGMRTFA